MLNLTDIVSYFFLFATIYFNVFLLITFFEKKSSIKEEERSEPRNFRSVTIIVPVYNEENTIRQTLESLLNLDYPKEKLKFIVVDDGSTDKTANVIKTFGRYSQFEIHSKENGGKFSALNLGIAKTKTDLVGCLDADSFVQEDTLKKIVKYFDNPEIMAVTPAIKIYKPNNLIRKLQSSEYNLGIFLKKALALINGITVTPGPFSIFRKKVFDEIGGFRPAHNTEDMEIAFRMHKHNYKITNSHQAVVYTSGPASYRALYKQRVRWMRGFMGNAIDYRFLFLRKKYSGVGMFILPFSALSIIGVLVMLALVLNNFARFLIDKFIQINTIGLNFNWRFSFDLFFVDASAKIILATGLLILTVILIGYGRKISEKKMAISLHSLYFPLVYSVLAIPWLLKAVYLTVVSKEARWK